MSLRALLFDVDGTVADTERLGHRPAYNKAFAEIGLPWTWGPKLYRRLLAQPGGRERLTHYLDSYDPELGEHASRARESTDTWVRDLHARKSHHFQAMLKRGQVPLRPGIERIMQDAHERGIKLALVSNASRATLEPVLKHALGGELRSMLALVISGEEVAAKKPAPDLYLRAMECLGFRTDECVAIEDSSIGLEAAVAAGLSTVITVNQNTAHETFNAAALVVDKLGDAAEPSTVIRGAPLEADFVTLADLEHLVRDAPTA